MKHGASSVPILVLVAAGILTLGLAIPVTSEQPGRSPAKDAQRYPSCWNCAAWASCAVVDSGCVDLVSISVDYGTSYSGSCGDYPACDIEGQCHNEATIRVSVATGYYLGTPDGCSDAPYSWSDPIDNCGARHEQRIYLHSGAPCTELNRVCDLVAWAKCNSCVR